MELARKCCHWRFSFHTRVCVRDWCRAGKNVVFWFWEGGRLLEWALRDHRRLKCAPDAGFDPRPFERSEPIRRSPLHLHNQNLNSNAENVSSSYAFWFLFALKPFLNPRSDSTESCESPRPSGAKALAVSRSFLLALHL